jgi:hypothetical protein
MTGPDLAFAYTQPRLQAWLAGRAGSAHWQRLQATGDLAALLQSSTTTPLAAWTARLRADADLHELEGRLRDSWVERVVQVAGWQPPRWRAALNWLRWLPWLGTLDALARGVPAAPWLRADALLGRLASGDASARGESLRSLGLAPLAECFAGRSRLLDGYAAHWRATWPADARSSWPELERLCRLARAHRSALAELPSTASSDAATLLLEQRLLATLRRHPLTPTAAVACLGLAALDLARLRGLVGERVVRTAATHA